MLIRESTIFELQMLLELIETLEKQVAEVESKIQSIWNCVNDQYFTQTIDGISDLRAAAKCPLVS
ncbi:MAG: hypothetical protein ACT6FD_05355 [Methanosarcinaceae archaeon]